MEINVLPERPWVEVGSDLFEWRNQTYLLTVDYYSKWIEVEELPSQTSFHVIKMLEKIFARFGIPEVLRTDNGPCYKSQSFFAFMESWGVVHKTSSPRSPESNERSKLGLHVDQKIDYMSFERLNESAKDFSRKNGIQSTEPYNCPS